MQIFDELRARGVKRSWHPVHGWRERIGGRRQGCIPACHGSALHRTPHPQFHPLHPTQAVECIHEAAEAHLWCHQRQAGPSGIREVQDRLAGLSGRSQRMGKQFHTSRLSNYGSAVRKIMYTTNAIESVNSSFRKVTKKGAFPTRMQSSRFSTYASKSSIKMEGSSRRKLGDGPEPAAHGRQDVSAYAAIRCCLLNRFTQNS